MSADRSPTKSDPRTLITLSDILSCISFYQSEDVELSNWLSESLSSSEIIFSSLSRLQSLLSHVDEVHAEASLLSTTVASTADTAQRIGGRVRFLDEEMRRVRESCERVGQVMDLKVIYIHFELIDSDFLSPVLVGVTSRLYRKSGLGSCNQALCSGNGTTQRSCFWTLCRSCRGE
jgi:hypothetical protein